MHAVVLHMVGFDPRLLSAWAFHDSGALGRLPIKARVRPQAREVVDHQQQQHSKLEDLGARVGPAAALCEECEHERERLDELEHAQKLDEVEQPHGAREVARVRHAKRERKVKRDRREQIDHEPASQVISQDLPTVLDIAAAQRALLAVDAVELDEEIAEEDNVAHQPDEIHHGE